CNLNVIAATVRQRADEMRSARDLVPRRRRSGRIDPMRLLRALQLCERSLLRSHHGRCRSASRQHQRDERNGETDETPHVCHDDSVADELVGPAVFPVVEHSLDVTTLSIVERHQCDETACFGRIVVCYCGFQPFALRRRLTQLPPQPAQERDGAHKTFTSGATTTHTSGNGTLPPRPPSSS